MGKNQNRGNKVELMKKILLIVITAILLTAFGMNRLMKYLDQKHYKDLAQSVKTTEAETTEEIQTTEAETIEETIPEETRPPYKSPIDFEALMAINPDIIGWITIQDTVIDYPIVQGPDNETYLHKDFEGNASALGTIFLDVEDRPDFSSSHNLLYGHHMKNGSMFKDVVKFKEVDFFQSHREFTIYTPDREIRLRTIACLYTDASGQRRQIEFEEQVYLDEYVDQMTRDCTFRELPHRPIRHLYSLVTCSYEFNNARTILYAYELTEGE